MNMQEAAARLGQIIKKLGGGTSVADQCELEELHAGMLDAAGTAAPKARQRKQRETRVEKTKKSAEAPSAPAKKAGAAKSKVKGK
jgi:hypothetical protein